MPRFDWNGNGKTDAFDTFMDMQVMSSSEDDKSSSFSDDDFSESNDNEDFETHSSSTGSSYRTYPPRATGTTQKSSMSFQDELRQNLRSPETVKQENAQRENNARMAEASLTMRQIKAALVQSAKDARYTTQNGVTTVSCICQIPQRFLRRRRGDNGKQLRENNQKFVLLRDPNLIYRTWMDFDLEPKNSSEYWQYMSALKQLAADENISIECVLQDAKENKIYPFPTQVPGTSNIFWNLCVRASTGIPSGSSNGTSQQKPTTYEVKQPVYEAKTVNETPAQQPQQNTQESNGSVIGKCALAIGLCVGAFALCMSGEFGELGMGLLLIGAAIVGYLILKK